MKDEHKRLHSLPDPIDKKRDRMIREYKPDDLDVLLEIWYEAARIAHPFWTDDLFVKERKAISEDHLATAETWVFEEGDRVVRFIALLSSEVGGIFVAPKWQGRGVGRALMDHARLGRDRLELDVFEANEVGRAFYDAYGFRVAGSRSDPGTGLTVLRMTFDCSSQ